MIIAVVVVVDDDDDDYINTISTYWLPSLHYLLGCWFVCLFCA